ncbi:MAG: ABC transporter substrate-binding protein [Deltaproteobacteria bacterium]|jgi:iron complex transport system substrate-binding protein|nr:ABC transporter substrate-binding protein [Deltaproteobacteria bacterium]
MASAEVQITDDLGQVISLQEPAKRIISLYGAYSEILFAMGLEDLLVARTRADFFPPAILNKPSVGTHLRPNMELVLGLQPDVILQASGRKYGHEVIRQIADKGLAVASFQPTTFEELFSVIHRLGTLTDHEEAADRLVKQLRNRLQQSSRRLTATEHRPSVFFEVRYPNLLGAGQQSIVNDVILKAGGINCLPNKKKLVRINIETLVGYNPEVYVVQKGPMNRNPADPKSRPNFRVLKAVEEERVLFVDEHIFSRPGPRSVEAVEKLAAFLHPDLSQ